MRAVPRVPAGEGKRLSVLLRLPPRLLSALSGDRVLGPAGIQQRLALVMDAADAASGLDRTRVVIIRNGRVAAIERLREGRKYWVLPGGGVEAGETIRQAALRETAEELGLEVRLGPLRAVVYGLDAAGAVLRHWCFDASADSDDIAISGGPELISTPESGTYKAVWLDLGQLRVLPVWPSALARLIAATRGSWPHDVLEISDDDS